MNNHTLLKDTTVNGKIRFLSIMGEFHRYDLAIINPEAPEDEIFILDINQNRFITISKSKVIDEEGYIEHTLNYTEIDAEELRELIKQVL
ncbi:SAV0927 family protein [Aquibacillus salsiterrae]|uniref:DUF3055 domain-containing protein n=1 Tax=Aquibacillus salsiterrae TaxID=2950439 RepID=A0A9X3WIV8_9BACI|nr:SAV0927 family protein [Aquibacillus salsiterrae]MDC3417871.1 DUF3055 domain-containing protein [Aquibacillus salsiterrae]